MRKMGLIIMLMVLPATLFAQTRQRWHLEFEHEHPEVYVRAGPLGQKDVYIYFVFEIKNLTDIDIPLAINIMLKIDVGKELMTDEEKAEIIPPRIGTYYTASVYPEIEEEIIIKHAKIAAESDPYIYELIYGEKGFKKNNRYLNLAELRKKELIQSKQTLQAMAIFKNVNLYAKKYEFYISGLVDPVVMVPSESPEEGSRLVASYENKALKITYKQTANVIAGQTPVFEFVRREWVTKSIGPIGSKEIVDNIVEELFKAVEALKKEKEPLLPLHNYHLMVQIVEDMFDIDFGFDETKGILENQEAISQLYYWWSKNRPYAYYDEILGKFLIKEKIKPEDKK